MNNEQLDRIKKGKGFIAALDQSGGSTPKALLNYGVTEDTYSTEEEMFQLVHEMRTRIITSPAFDSEHILGAILFEQTMNSEIEGLPTAEYLAEKKGIVPFLKVDNGLDEQANGVQLMKPMPDLDALLNRANKHKIFGTKMRSVIHEAHPEGIQAVVTQQFDVGKQIIEAGLVPIIEPEVNILSEEKEAAESILKESLLEHLDKLSDKQAVMLKLSIPTEANLYLEVIKHPKVVRTVALSGGYSLQDANEKLRQNEGLIASFSRALSNGLKVKQTDEEFNAALQEAVEAIYDVSVNKK